MQDHITYHTHTKTHTRLFGTRCCLVDITAKLLTKSKSISASLSRSPHVSSMSITLALFISLHNEMIVYRRKAMLPTQSIVRVSSSNDSVRFQFSDDLRPHAHLQPLGTSSTETAGHHTAPELFWSEIVSRPYKVAGYIYYIGLTHSRQFFLSIARCLLIGT